MTGSKTTGPKTQDELREIVRQQLAAEWGVDPSSIGVAAKVWLDHDAERDDDA